MGAIAFEPPAPFGALFSVRTFFLLRMNRIISPTSEYCKIFLIISTIGWYLLAYFVLTITKNRCG
jgi:hypothetical protein